MTTGETLTLYWPVGPEELELIRQSGFAAFPPRLPDQAAFISAPQRWHKN